MDDGEGNANDSNDTASTVVKNPYIKNIPSVTYEEVQAKAIAAAASRGKSSNGNSSNGSNKKVTKRKRRQTAQQVRAQVEKCRNTKERNKPIKEAAKAKAEEEKKKEEAANAKKQPFFRKYTTNNKTNETNNNTNESTNNNDKDETNNNDTNNENVGFIGPLRNENNLTSDIEDKDDEDVEGDKDEDVVVDNPPLTTKTPYDIIANLDYDEEEERGKNDSDDPPVEGNGVMQEYLKAVKERLQIELSGNELDAWLMDILKKNDWWLRTSYASKIRKKLCLPNHYDAYYRDIFVWLPDIRWNDPAKTFMPPCPHCKCNTRVGAHGFRGNHHARLVVNLNTTYYIMSRRYICHECKQVNKQAKAILKASAEQQGINMTIPEEDQNERAYTFMGYDKRSLPLFKYNRGETEFPAYFTWRAGLDKTIINMMRPLFDGGFRPERLSDLLLELHSKEYTMQCIKHENMILQNRESIEQNKNYTPLTSFGDKKHYHGIVPSGEYLAAVHKLYHESLRGYMDMEVKKRGAETLHWDVSYKEAKHLCRYHGRPIFKGLVTAVNEIGEVRIQFHVYTDSHEQMKSALQAFKLTTNEPNEVVTLGDMPEGQSIVVPIRMIKEHVTSSNIRTTPIDKTSTSEPRSKPSTDDPPIEKRKRKKPSTSPSEGYEYMDLTVDDDDDDDDEDVEYVKYSEEEELEDEPSPKTLTSADIEYLFSALSKADILQQNERSVLESPYLSSPPDPKRMKRRFSSVLGDVFHAMDRTKVPVKHEAKKAFFVALREAFFVWNPQKLKELEDKMRDSGMTDDEIKKQKYFNTQLFKDCVDRKVPESTILYWRVRAVYVAYGDVVDSETKKPLFNKRAWSKANNVLKEILLGFYSDPPGIELYNKKLRVDGTVMTNKYGLEMLECSRGTNRTEAYHKNITTTFDSWPTGLTMSDCLLRERRHRHNQKVAEKRRFSFPKIGHYDTWLIDLYQSLAQRNHDLLVYPEWTNTSEYKFTNESFDTIPLQTKSLQEAVENRCKELDDKTIKLTKDQQHLAKAMGSKLPFLPITGEEERKTYAKFVTETDASILKDDDAAAVAWCKYVDGVHTFPKLPSHLRTHQEEWKRNQRVKECEERNASKKAKLDELNKKISPTHRSEINEINTTPPTEAATSQQITEQQQPTTSIQQPIFGVPWCSVIQPAPTFYQPNPQAFIHQPRAMSVGGFTIGSSTTECERVELELPRQSKRKPRSCGLCRDLETDPRYLHRKLNCRGQGRAGRAGCEYFDVKTNEPRSCGKCGNNGYICKGGVLGNNCMYIR